MKKKMQQRNVFISEKWDFPNPCTRENMDNNITKFVHPYDTSKFLMCGEMGKLYIVQCPQREVRSFLVGFLLHCLSFLSYCNVLKLLFQMENQLHVLRCPKFRRVREDMKIRHLVQSIKIGLSEYIFIICFAVYFLSNFLFFFFL